MQLLEEEQEKPKKKRKGGPNIAYIMRMQDEKLAAQHRYELNPKNRCPKCFVLKTALGKCTMGCDD